MLTFFGSASPLKFIKEAKLSFINFYDGIEVISTCVYYFYVVVSSYYFEIFDIVENSKNRYDYYSTYLFVTIIDTEYKIT